MTEDEGGQQSPEQIREEIESLLGTTVSNLGKLVKEGSKQTKNIKCPHCSQFSAHEFKVADADLLVKSLNALSAAAPRLKGKDEGSGKAAKIQTDLSEMTNAELAAYIAKLKEEIDTAQEG